MFRATGKGFNITFENGWTASIQWGPGNYCDNRSSSVSLYAKPEDVPPSRTAEIAAWDANNKWHSFGDDTVKGWVKPDEVAKFLNMVSRKKAVKTDE